MSKIVKKITFGLENCETITFKNYDFLNFIVKNVETSIHRFACNSIGKFTTAKDIAFCIFKEANYKYENFGQEQEGWIEEAFNRLSQNDITDIEIEYEDGTTETYYTDWNDYDDNINMNQSTEFNDRGDLICIISANENKNWADYDGTDVYNEREMKRLKESFYDFSKKYDKEESKNGKEKLEKIKL